MLHTRKSLKNRLFLSALFLNLNTSLYILLMLAFQSFFRSRNFKNLSLRRKSYRNIRGDYYVQILQFHIFDRATLSDFATWEFNTKEDLTLFRMGVRVEKRLLTSFSPLTSTNIRISPETFLIFSFNSFVTLMSNFKTIPSTSSKLLNLNQEYP